jgi:SAM-dependent methyltransferase
MIAASPGVDAADSTTTVQCRVCGSDDTTFLFEAESLWPTGDRMRRFFACGDCGALVDPNVVGPPYAVDANADLTDRVPHVKYYLEVAAGVGAFANFLCLTRQALGSRGRNARLRLLDVGTAFGFLVAMAQRLGWDGVGVEPSGVARLGNKILGVPILTGSLDEVNLAPQTFDAILSCEVIEHVPDPRGLMMSLARHLARDGVLLITTPNADVLRDRPAAEPDWHETLAPGHHLNLLSPEAMTRLLHDNGLKDVRLLFSGGTTGRKHIVAVAARRPGTLPEHLDWGVACREANELTIDYLGAVVAERERARVDDVFYRGALSRLMQLHIDRGEYERALPYSRRIDELLRSEGLDGDAPRHLTASTFEDYVTRVPAFLGLHCYYRGMLEANHLGDHAAAAASFATAAHVCRLEDSVGSFPRIGWFERARLHEGLALLRAGRHAEAIEVFDGLIANRDTVPADLLDQLYRQKILAHLDLGEHEAIRRFVTDWAEPRTGSDGSDRVTSTLVAQLESARRELREMAALYREDRYALLRINRAFDLLRGPRRLLARFRGRGRRAAT